MDSHVKKIHNKPDVTYTCQNCNGVFSSSSNLKQHIKIVHESESSVFCEICKKEFKGKNQLKRHEKNVHMELREFGCKLCKERFKRPWHLTRHHQLIHEKQSNNVKNVKSEASRSSTESFSSPLIQSPETSSNNSQQNITNNNQSIGSNSHNSSSLVTVKEEPDLSSVLSDPAISNNDICTNNSFENSIQPQSQNNQNDAVVNANPSANIDSFNKILNNNSIESSSPLDFIGTSDNNFSLDQQSFANVNETTATSTNYINAQQPQTPQPYYPSAVAASANSAMQWDMANYDSNKNYQISESPYTNYNSADYSSLSTTYQSNVAMVSKLWMRILSVPKFALKIYFIFFADHKFVELPASDWRSNGPSTIATTSSTIQ